MAAHAGEVFTGEFHCKRAQCDAPRSWNPPRGRGQNTYGRNTSLGCYGNTVHADVQKMGKISGDVELADGESHRQSAR